MTNTSACPFCFSMDLHIMDEVCETGFFVCCLGCGAVGPSGESEEMALEAWESRGEAQIANLRAQGGYRQ